MTTKKKKTKKATAPKFRDATQNAVAEAGSPACEVQQKPKKETTAEWARQNGYEAVWKSVPKKIRKDFAEARKIVLKGEAGDLADRIEKAQQKLQKLRAIENTKEFAKTKMQWCIAEFDKWKKTYEESLLGFPAEPAAAAS